MNLSEFDYKLTQFAVLVGREQLEVLAKHNYTYPGWQDNAKTTIKAGKKWAKIDVGTSGKFMVDLETGEIFGIKAYGVVHKGHPYGTLDTINDWFWGEYYPILKPAICPTCGQEGCQQ